MSEIFNKYIHVVTSNGAVSRYTNASYLPMVVEEFDLTFKEVDVFPIVSCGYVMAYIFNGFLIMNHKSGKTCKDICVTNYLKISEVGN